ncbi:MAG: hypothetical protein LRY22_00525, partial [Aliarcobacter cryaerophilus]|nr:hypothetical protein [Aliarcobacter cryaerophilus]
RKNFLILLDLDTLFQKKIENYQENRDYFYLDASSNLSVHLRFGLVSARTLFNKIKKAKCTKKADRFFL